MEFDLSHFIEPRSHEVSVRIRPITSQFINLSNNEMKHEELTQLIQKFGQQYQWSRISHYPNCLKLREKIANFFELDEQNVLLSAGTDQAISQLFPFLGAKSKTLILQTPNYFNYENYAIVNGFKIIPVSFFEIENGVIAQHFYQCAKNNPHSIFVITTPHVYSGTCLSAELIQSIIAITAEFSCLLVIDEAYQAYSHQDLLSLVKQNIKNVLVLRSFSKSFGLAGMRVGGAFGHPDLINYLKKVGILGCVNDPALNMLSFLIDHYYEINKIRQDLVMVRDDAIQFIRDHFQTWKVLESQANFVSFFVENIDESDALAAFMLSKNILIKQLKNIESFTNAVRITVTDHRVFQSVIGCFSQWKKMRIAI